MFLTSLIRTTFYANIPKNPGSYRTSSWTFTEVTQITNWTDLQRPGSLSHLMRWAIRTVQLDYSHPGSSHVWVSKQVAPLTFTLKIRITRNSSKQPLSRALPNKHFEASAAQALVGRKQLFLNILPLPLSLSHLPIILLTMFCQKLPSHRIPLTCSHSNQQVC